MRMGLEKRITRIACWPGLGARRYHRPRTEDAMEGKRVEIFGKDT